jgi:hypothetical protein
LRATPMSLASTRELEEFEMEPVLSTGFDSGPRRLNIVRQPSSFRIGATCLIPGWNVGANRKA